MAFVVAGDRQAVADFYPPPAVAIPVTGPLTVELFVTALRTRPYAWGMRRLLVDQSVPVEQLLDGMASLFRQICPFLSPQGTEVLIVFTHHTVTPAQLRAPLTRICPRAIFNNQGNFQQPVPPPRRAP